MIFSRHGDVCHPAIETDGDMLIGLRLRGESHGALEGSEVSGEQGMGNLDEIGITTFVVRRQIRPHDAALVVRP